VHDAFLICAPIDRIEADTAAMRAAMDEAARAVLDGFPIPTEARSSAIQIATWTSAAPSCGSGSRASSANAKRASCGGNPVTIRPFAKPTILLSA
jgi:hypothetical protein